MHFERLQPVMICNMQPTSSIRKMFYHFCLINVTPNTLLHTWAFLTQYVIFICCRPWRSESIGWCIRQWTTSAGHGTDTDSRTGPSGRPTVRHLQTTPGVPWLCEQNTGQVSHRYTYNYDLIILVFP